MTLNLTLSGIITFILIMILLLWIVPKFQARRIKKIKDIFIEGEPSTLSTDLNSDERFSLENEARRTLIQIIGGVVLLLGLFFTAESLKVNQDTLKSNQENLTITQQNLQKTIEISDREQVAGRFSKAMAQLGDKEPATQFGGIYALEKIAQDHSKEYYWTILESLTAFIRVKHPRHCVDPECTEPEEPFYQLPAEIQAVLNVIKRRQFSYANGEDQPLDLNYTVLKSADLRNANLSHADLRGADLYKANLTNANLEEARLETKTDVIGRNWHKVNLSNAYLNGANLKKAHLAGAILSQADLDKADLTGADLSDADLRSINLTWEQIDSGIIDVKTKVAPEFEDKKQEKLKRQQQQ